VVGQVSFWAIEGWTRPSWILVGYKSTQQFHNMWVVQAFIISILTMSKLTWTSIHTSLLGFSICLFSHLKRFRNTFAYYLHELATHLQLWLHWMCLQYWRMWRQSKTMVMNVLLALCVYPSTILPISFDMLKDFWN